MTEERSVTRWLGLHTDADGEYILDAKSFITALGGFWGLIETAVPAIAFSASFGLWRNVVLSVILAVLFTVIIFVSQVIRKRPILNALSSLLGIGIAAWLALAGGASGATARDFYLKDFFTTGFSLAVLLISLLIRRPILGYVLHAFSQLPDDWRESKQLLRRANFLTLFWAGLFVVRLSIQIPVYLVNQVVALGVLKTALGMPLYGLWLLATASVLKAQGRKHRAG